MLRSPATFPDEKLCLVLNLGSSNLKAALVDYAGV